MAKVFIEEQTLTDIADAVRAKSGTTEPIRTLELATAITNLPTGGGENKLQQYFDKTLTELKPEDFGSASTAPSFEGFSQLTYVEYSDNINAIPISGLRGCGRIDTVIFPATLKQIGNQARRYTTLTNVYFKGTLSQWLQVTGMVNDSACFTDGSNFYIDNVSLENYDVVIPNDITTINPYILYGSKITSVDMHSDLTTISKAAFANCSALNNIILRGDTVKTLSSTTAFDVTPIASGTGTIYIQPDTVDEATLVAEYKAATNWSTYEAQIKPYSEYTGGAA